ncbi:MAG: peptide ABC transporter substrate-binding protein, partial [Pseudomonadota bacterium]
MKNLTLTAAACGLLAGAAQAETLRIPHGVGYAGSESLDPISPQRFYEMNQTLYSRLVRQDNDGMIVPDLATEWSASADAKTWSFKLRDGVTLEGHAV